jgi:hypothetical protein
MTDELSPRARAIVDAARDADDPTEADRRRVRAALSAAIAASGVAAAAPVAKAAGSAAAAGVGASASAVPLLAKAMAVTATLAAVGVGAYLVAGDRRPERASGDDGARATAPTRRHGADSATAPDRPPHRPGDGMPAADGARSERDAAHMGSDDDAVVEFDVDRVGAPDRRPSTISAERELVAGARAAHRSGRPADALSALDHYARRFAGGKLLEERSALRVLVLCDLGRTSLAVREARAFLRRWPGSVQAERVRGSCAGGATE